MKLILVMLISSSLFAAIPAGSYKLDKIQCSTGKVLKLGGKFMIYDVTLDVTSKDWTMTAIAKSASWSPFKLNCKQVNKGDFTYTRSNILEGEMKNESVKCNAKAWTAILKKKLFGVDEFSEFTYEVKGKKLVLKNPSTKTKYSCKKTNGYPVYYYTKN